MKLSIALFATAFSGTSAFTSVSNGPRLITSLNADRQPIMAGKSAFVYLHRLIECVHTIGYFVWPPIAFI